MPQHACKDQRTFSPFCLDCGAWQPGLLATELSCWGQQESLDADLVHNQNQIWHWKSFKYSISTPTSGFTTPWKLFFILNGFTWFWQSYIFTFVCRTILMSVLKFNMIILNVCVQTHSVSIRWPSVSCHLIGLFIMFFNM